MLKEECCGTSPTNVSPLLRIEKLNKRKRLSLPGHKPLAIAMHLPDTATAYGVWLTYGEVGGLISKQHRQTSLPVGGRRDKAAWSRLRVSWGSKGFSPLLV